MRIERAAAPQSRTLLWPSRDRRIARKNERETPMRSHLRRAALAICCLLAAFAAPASAQDWPMRNITVIVPLGAGSASDIIARVVMEQVGRQLGQNVIVENRPGAGGTIGANMVAKAAPDGYTILIYGALASAHALYSKLPYDTLADFIPVDRKSTRLNSSHDQISYAVFCLKKKKNTNKHPQLPNTKCLQLRKDWAWAAHYPAQIQAALPEYAVGSNDGRPADVRHE